ncbi:hypothetical protein CFK41_12845 [Brachybacterium ginsengisoli]|uniref:DUF4287 domain-containing protein n=1 Tax=Brachybacterium ginsengisoli TaxID=1331682 RepID=A0A291GZB7_9MICO|nr:hypothetical protein [Brachybacterium ginsengisoli]ATG55559.1 hypothetical protein CFK41_12845 [Brachybacterium ginsengisoli]
MSIPPQEHRHAARIEAGTSVPLEEWTRRLDEAGARELDHTAIARLLGERWEVSGWWAQGVTVAYEQVIGRRVVGQSCEGDFSASASRTVPGDPDAVRESWDAFMTPERREELGLEEPRLTDTTAWRYWRAAVQDGTRLSVNITAKDEGRSTLGIDHKGIETAEGREVWKTAWKRTLTDFTASAASDQETR